MSAQSWKTLGIGKTDDKAAIRRAYAEKLKALDVDRDVAAFAQLRQARDTALRLAAQAAARQAEAPPVADDPLLPDDGSDLGLLADDDDFAPGLADGLAPSASVDAEAIEPDPDQRVPDMLRALAAIVFPNGDYSDEGFTLPDYEAAQALVTDLVDEARNGRLETAHFIDYHLAEMLAQGWPRSAALVEAPAEEFHWLDEAGSLDERPALRFLNDRIKGMKFHQKVQVPGHALNKAWAELSRPEDEVKWAHRRAVNSEDVRTLLNGIRERFPELESYLNAERVSAWERRFSGGGGGHSFDGVPWWAVAVGLLFMLRLCASIADDTAPHTTTNPAPPALYSPEGFADPSQAVPAQGAQLAINAIVGADNADRLQNEAYLFDRGVRDAYMLARQDGGDHEAGLRAARQYARQFALFARREAQFAELVAIDEMLRRWLRSAEVSGNLGADCPYRANSNQNLGDLLLDYRDDPAEKLLYGQLLEAGLLDDQPVDGALSAGVPGEVMEAIVAQTGLPLETVREALNDDGHPQRCRVILAALDKVLAAPATVPVDLLRLL